MRSNLQTDKALLANFSRAYQKNCSDILREHFAICCIAPQKLKKTIYRKFLFNLLYVYCV